MRQRVGIAMALTNDPDVIIADEPTTALDVTVQAQILAFLDDLRRTRNLSILFITHDFGVVGQLCDRVAVMYAGRIVETGPTADVLQSPQHPYTERLIQSVPELGGGKRELVAIPGLPPAVDDLPPGCAFAPRCLRAQPDCSAADIALTPALRATNLSKNFPVGRSLLHRSTGVIQAVRPMDLTVARGETLGIVGESGCGKSTLARMLVGLSTPTTGTIEIDGAPFDTSNRRLSSQQIQYVFQDPQSSLNPRKTIRAIMESPLKSPFNLTRAERADRIAQIFARPRQPYTRLLAESAPVVGKPLLLRDTTETELPDPLNPPPGCAFAARCPKVSDLCRANKPALSQTGDSHFAACHHPD